MNSHQRQLVLTCVCLCLLFCRKGSNVEKTLKCDKCPHREITEQTNLHSRLGVHGQFAPSPPPPHPPRLTSIMGPYSAAGCLSSRPHHQRRGHIKVILTGPRGLAPRKCPGSESWRFHFKINNSLALQSWSSNRS